MPLKFFYAKTCKKEFLFWTCVNFVSRGFSKTKTNCVGFSDSSGQRFRIIAISFQLAHVSCHMLEAVGSWSPLYERKEWNKVYWKKKEHCNQKEKPINWSNILFFFFQDKSAKFIHLISPFLRYSCAPKNRRGGFILIFGKTNTIMPSLKIK